jgi:predicted phosphodiesterase
MAPVDEVVRAGDVVRYDPMPSACIEQVREVVSIAVQGNHDRAVETPNRYRGNEKAYAGLKYTQSQLLDGQRQ